MKAPALLRDSRLSGKPSHPTALYATASQTLQDHQEVIGDTTNNVAEYTAVIRGLEMSKALGAQEIHSFVDSQLVARQLCGEYRVKTPHIRDLFLQVKEREKTFQRVTYEHVPRTHEKLQYVDKLVNRALNEAGY